MRDLLFRCPHCAAGLAFDRKLAGKELSCPSCKGRIAVPVPDASFNCPSCNAQLHAASDASGEFECPACKGAIVIEGEEAPDPTPQEAERTKLRLKDRPVEWVREDSPPASRRCPRCQAEVGAQDVICVQCGTDLRNGRSVQTPYAARNAATAPPPTHRPLSNVMVWTLCCIPLLGSIIEWIAGWNIPWPLYLLANAGLCVADERLLKRSGQQVRYGLGLALLVIPAYLWARATALSHRFRPYFWAWTAAALVSFVVDYHVGTGRQLEESAVPVVTDILKENLGGAAKCMAVRLGRELTNGVHWATASLDDGSTIAITIADRGKQIEVNVPDMLSYLVSVKRAATASGNTAKIDQARKMVAAHTRALVRDCLAGLKAENPTQDVAAAVESVVGVGGMWRGRADLFHGAGDDGPREALDLYQQGVQAHDRKDYTQAVALYTKATQKDAGFPWAFNNLAWTLATSPEGPATVAKANGRLGTRVPDAKPAILDGPRAVETAKAALDIVGVEYWGFAGTLAAAYARSGDFEHAVQWQEKAISTAPADQKGHEQEYLVIFRNRRAAIGDEAAICMENLRAIDAVKKEASRQFGGIPAGCPLTEGMLGIGLSHTSGRSMPECPEGGTYSAMPVGVFPRCSKHGMLLAEAPATDETGLRKCAGCDAAIRQSSAVCPYCGLMYDRKCPDCGRPLSVKDSTACYYCKCPSPLATQQASGVDHKPTLDERQEAAAHGDPKAQFDLAVMFANGTDGCEKDLDKAREWLRKAAERGFADAQVSLGVMFYEGNGVRRDAAEAVRWFRKAADSGSSAAALNMGIAFGSGGPGLPQDEKAAAQWFRRAAEAGNAQAQRCLSICCREGRGIPRDSAEAARWCLKAAESGDADAQFNMGVHYQSGLGVTQNPAAALKWYRAAAAQGQQDAKQALAGMGSTPSQDQSANVAGSLSDGERDPQSRTLLEQGLASQERGDSAQAVRYFRQAAERGSAWGQNNLGINYLQGDGVPKDAAEGVRWLRKAAAQGLREAQAALGTCYVQGSGVEKDLAEGAMWYTKAAGNGDPVAQRQLCLMYAFGMGVPKSNTEAARWAREAASRGDAQAKEWIAKWDAHQAASAPRGAAPSVEAKSLAMVDDKASSSSGMTTVTEKVACRSCDGSGVFPGLKRANGTRDALLCVACKGTGKVFRTTTVSKSATPTRRGSPDGQPKDFGHVNPWGAAGERVVGRYPTYEAAVRAKEGTVRKWGMAKGGMEGLSEAAMDALAEQVINAGDAVMTIQRPPEYRIERDRESGMWLLIEQRF